MKLRGRGVSKEPAPNGAEPPDHVPRAWERITRVLVVSGVLVSVTLATGSAQDGLLVAAPLLPLLR